VPTYVILVPRIDPFLVRQATPWTWVSLILTCILDRDECLRARPVDVPAAQSGQIRRPRARALLSWHARVGHVVWSGIAIEPRCVSTKPGYRQTRHVFPSLLQLPESLSELDDAWASWPTLRHPAPLRWNPCCHPPSNSRVRVSFWVMRRGIILNAHPLWANRVETRPQGCESLVLHPRLMQSRETLPWP
jgi:hypothetical protein